MWCRGIRGATTCAENTKEAILEATDDLLRKLIIANDIQIDDVCSAFFTATSDLNAEFPALAARKLGWTSVSLMCAHEMNVPGALPQCIRILIQINTTRRADEIRHVYIRGASHLVPGREFPIRWRGGEFRQDKKVINKK